MERPTALRGRGSACCPRPGPCSRRTAATVQPIEHGPEKGTGWNYLKRVRGFLNGTISGEYGDFGPMAYPWSHRDRGSCGFSEGVSGRHPPLWLLRPIRGMCGRECRLVSGTSRYSGSQDIHRFISISVFTLAGLLSLSGRPCGAGVITHSTAGRICRCKCFALLLWRCALVEVHLTAWAVLVFWVSAPRWSRPRIQRQGERQWVLQ